MLGKSNINPLISQVNSRPSGPGNGQPKHLLPRPRGTHPGAAAQAEHPEHLVADHQQAGRPAPPGEPGVAQKSLSFLLPATRQAKTVAGTRRRGPQREGDPPGGELRRPGSRPGSPGYRPTSRVQPAGQANSVPARTVRKKRAGAAAASGAARARRSGAAPTAPADGTRPAARPSASSRPTASMCTAITPRRSPRTRSRARCSSRAAAPDGGRAVRGDWRRSPLLRQAARAASWASSRSAPRSPPPGPAGR